jgi:hypothetical protein
MRPKHPHHLDGELYTGTGVCQQQPPPNRDVQHTPKQPQFLMDRRWFESVLLPDASGTLNSDSRLEPPPKIEFDIIRRDLAHHS